jgi:uncharacterized repeat protein (TIGR01451 family)
MKKGARTASLVAVLSLGILVVLLMLSSLSTSAASGEIDLAIDLEAPAHVAAGSTFLVNVAYYNLGTEPAPNAQVTATLPVGTQFITSTDRGGVPLPPDVVDGNTLSWYFEGPDYGTPPGACCGHILLTLQADEDLSEGTALTTTASITTTAVESDTTNNEASVVSVVCAMAGSGKQVNARYAMPGDVLTYTINISRAHQYGGNPDGDQGDWVTLTDTLPFSHQVRFLGWNGTVTGTVHDGQMLMWQGRVQAGEQVQLQYRLGVEGVVTPGTTISNTAMLRWRQRLMQLGPVTTVITLPHGALALGPNQYGEVTHRYGVTLTVPPGAVSDTTRFQLGPLFTDTRPTDPPPGLMFANRAFEMNAFRFGYQVRQFNQPLTVTLRFSDTNAPRLERETLRLWTRSGPEGPWAMLGEPVRVMSGALAFTTTHLSQFALFGRGEYQIYLPLIAR